MGARRSLHTSAPYTTRRPALLAARRPALCEAGALGSTRPGARCSSECLSQGKRCGATARQGCGGSGVRRPLCTSALHAVQRPVLLEVRRPAPYEAGTLDSTRPGARCSSVFCPSPRQRHRATVRQRYGGSDAVRSFCISALYAVRRPALSQPGVLRSTRPAPWICGPSDQCSSSGCSSPMAQGREVPRTRAHKHSVILARVRA